MKIDLNKDFETQFKSESWKGFSSDEAVCGGIALGLAAIVVLSIWHVTGLPINVCVYFGIPIMIPVVVLGLLMEELDKTHRRIFSMQHPVGKKKGVS